MFARFAVMGQNPHSGKDALEVSAAKGVVASSEKSFARSLSQRLLIKQLEVSSRFSRRKTNVDRSTQSLAVAILTQALRDVLSTEEFGAKQVAGGWQRDALQWFASDEEHPGSLRWVSEVVDIRVEDIRNWISLLPNERTERRKWRAKFRRPRRRF
jgi:hypothetical protein